MTNSNSPAHSQQHLQCSRWQKSSRRLFCVLSRSWLILFTLVALAPEPVSAQLWRPSTGPTGPRGTQGPKGDRGAIGPQGVKGLTGAKGAPGTNGLNGAIGPMGPAGTNGLNGINGTNGVDGAIGPMGPAGTNGLNGINGTNGVDGANGLNGTNGVDGASGSSEYGYIYNLDPQPTVAVNAAVIFSHNGLGTAGITHNLGTSDIVFATPGVYKVNFSVSGVEPNQFALFLNGIPVPESVYGSGAGTQQNNGQAILTIGANDILTLCNHSSAAAITLTSIVGGTEANVNASILIQKLN